MTVADPPVETASEAVRTDAALLLQQAYQFFRTERWEAAADLTRRVLAEDPGEHNALYLLGMCYASQKNHDLAITFMKRSVAIDPDAEVWHNLGLVYATIGDLDAALVCYRRALRLEPAYLAAAANLIFALDLHPSATPEQLQAERRRFNDQFCAPLTRAAAAHTNDRDPNRRLRIGFVSGDFKHHSAAMSFSSLIQHADERRVESYLYSTLHPSKEDLVTQAFKAKADVWSEVWEIDDQQLAEQIRTDRIDVLVDLSAYSRDGRMLTFARRPAPIAVTGIGYATGTGLDCMDYLISDAIAIPPEHEDRYTEKIMRLPCLVGYEPYDHAPEIEPPPCLRNGYVTFGYLGRPPKLNDRVLAAWARIMRRVPGSRLLMKADDFREAAVREAAIDPLVALGIDASRVELRGATTKLAHLATYNRVDLALDSFPAGGGGTTLDACLMGVATVAMLGEHVPSRQSAAIIAHVGLAAAGTTVDEYVEHAVALAADPERLGIYRRTLRGKLLASPIVDGPGYARAFERRVRAAWRAWCKTTPSE